MTVDVLVAPDVLAVGVDGNKTVAAVAGAVPVSVSVSASVSWSWRTSWFPCVSPARAVGWRVWDGAPHGRAR